MEIKKLHDVMDLLRQEIGNVTLLQAQILLSVMIDEPVNQPDLVVKYKSTGATISRNTNLFRDREIQTDQGKWVRQHGFVRFQDDSNDARKLTISLNERGTELKKRLTLFR